jgi:HTH-type transcriptional regulator/antitoxin HigA
MSRCNSACKLIPTNLTGWKFFRCWLKKYEDEHYPVPEPSIVEAIKYGMGQLNSSDAELSEVLGARSRKSEILSGKRKLSPAMRSALKERPDISADILIQI